MKIDDGAFSIKSNKLKEDLYSLNSSLIDSSIASSIQGDIDAIKAEELVELMKSVSSLLNCQIKNIETVIAEKRKTFIIHKDEEERQ